MLIGGCALKSLNEGKNAKILPYILLVTNIVIVCFYFHFSVRINVFKLFLTAILSENCQPIFIIPFENIKNQERMKKKRKQTKFSQQSLTIISITVKIPDSFVKTDFLLILFYMYICYVVTSRMINQLYIVFFVASLWL